jgi:hypothetical protein
MRRSIENFEQLTMWLALRRLGYSNAEIGTINELEHEQICPHCHPSDNLDENMCDDEYDYSELDLMPDFIKKNKNRQCNKFNFNHSAAIINSNSKSLQVLCTGQNKSYVDGSSIHAEVDAINHLPPRKNWNKRLLIVDLLVVRISKSGNLGNSAPCIHCLRTMTHLPHKMGYHINKVYYSNPEGQIVHYKLDDLIAIDEMHVTSYHRSNGFNIKNYLKWRAKYLTQLIRKKSK